MMKSEEGHGTFWEHVEALRNTLIKGILAIVVGSLLCFYLYPEIIGLLTGNLSADKSEASPLKMEAIEYLRVTNRSDRPFPYSLPPGSMLSTPHTLDSIGRPVLQPHESIEFSRPKAPTKLQILSPTEGLITALKISFWLGLVLTSPLWLYFLMTFIAPALHAGEKLMLLPFLTFSLLFFLAGLAFAYFFTLPIANNYFSLFNAEIGTNSWSLANYLDYTLLLMLSNGLAFEAANILFFLVHYRLISSQQLAKQRNLVIVGAFILAAILTPPDVITQVMLAVPLILIYEAAILYSRLISPPPQSGLNLEPGF